MKVVKVNIEVNSIHIISTLHSLWPHYWPAQSAVQLQDHEGSKI